MKRSHTFLGRTIVFMVLSFCTVDFSYAAATATQACSINQGLSEELTAYVATLGKLLSKIETEAMKKQCGTNGTESTSANINKTLSAFVGSMNESIGFSNFTTSTRFYVGMALKTEIPPGITRGHEQLWKEIDHIKNTIGIVHGQCAENVIPPINLSDDPSYTTLNKSLGTILREVLINQVDMMNFYRQTVLGDSTEGVNFKLVWNSADFVTKFQGHYGPSAFNNCNGTSDFRKSIDESFARISRAGKGIDDGMAEWRKASDLLKENSSNAEYAEIEKNLLLKELSRQGVSSRGVQLAMDCLSQYNNTGIRCGLVGGLTDAGVVIGENVQVITEVYNRMKDLLGWLFNGPTTTDRYIETVKVAATLNLDINKSIMDDYTLAKNLMWPEDMSANETTNKLIETHVTLESTNKLVKTYIKIAEQLCNKQSSGNGNCRF